MQRRFNMSYENDINTLMQGAIDMHVHLNPHMAPDTHIMDIEQYVAEARKAGMRGAVVKDAAFPTTGTTYLANKHSDDVKLFGSIALNWFVGGINADAVEAALHHGDGAKVIFFPLGDSYQHICARERFYRGINPPRPKEKGIRVLRDGKLIPEAIEILDIIAKEDVCLATGHLSPEESKALVGEARRRGVNKIIVSHALWKMIGFTHEELIELADQGAYIEFEFGMCLPIMYFNHGEPAVNPLETAALMHRIGPERCLMSTDCGQIYQVSPVEAMRYFISVMLKCDMMPEEIELMVRKNPEILLGLPEWKPTAEGGVLL
jgi:hypothetical protein